MNCYPNNFETHVRRIPPENDGIRTNAAFAIIFRALEYFDLADSLNSIKYPSDTTLF